MPHHRALRVLDVQPLGQYAQAGIGLVLMELEIWVEAADVRQWQAAERHIAADHHREQPRGALVTGLVEPPTVRGYRIPAHGQLTVHVVYRAADPTDRPVGVGAHHRQEPARLGDGVVIDEADDLAPGLGQTEVPGRGDPVQFRLLYQDDMSLTFQKFQ